MIRGDGRADPALEARLQRPKVPSGDLDANFDHAVALALVALRVLLGDRVEVLDFHPEGRERALDQLLNGRLVVALEDDSGVPHPLDVPAHQLHDVLILIDSLHGDLMREHRFGPRTSHDQALGYPACLPLLHDLRVALIVGLDVVEVLSPEDALGGDEEVVDADYGDDLGAAAFRSSSALFAESLALDTLPAPRPVLGVSNPVLLNF